MNTAVRIRLSLLQTHMQAQSYKINQLLGKLLRTYNIQETYKDYAELWIGILAAAAFGVRSTYQTTKVKVPGQLVFNRDMILPVSD